jgi:Arc/MetJ-type ribon-helix-helix transcriptional regulator
MTIKKGNRRHHITLSETTIDRLVKRGYKEQADISEFIKAAVIFRLDELDNTTTTLTAQQETI